MFKFHARPVLAVAAGVLGLGLIASLSPAGSSGATAAGPKTIEIKGPGNNLRFEGPKKVSSGAPLRVLNKTAPEKVGPHSFTLLQRKLVPKTQQQLKKCKTPAGSICRLAGQAHEASNQGVGKRSVDNGQPGWDRLFRPDRFGDSWFTDRLGERTTREVSAQPGKTLRFICVIHPFMQGKIEVVK